MHNLKTTRLNFTNFCRCCLWPWLGPPVTALWYDVYFRFYGWHHVSYYRTGRQNQAWHYVVRRVAALDTSGRVRQRANAAHWTLAWQAVFLQRPRTLQQGWATLVTALTIQPPDSNAFNRLTITAEIPIKLCLKTDTRKYKYARKNC